MLHGRPHRFETALANGAFKKAAVACSTTAKIIDGMLTHDSPPHSRSLMESSVNILNCGNALVHKTYRLSPDCTRQAVGNVTGNFFQQYNRCLTKQGVEGLDGLQHSIVCLGARNKLHQIDHVWWVERMRHKRSFRVVQNFRHLGDEQTTCGRSYHGCCRCILLDLFPNFAFHFIVLKDGLLDEISIRHRCFYCLCFEQLC
mmetsp:Transcript_13163/g.24494  ORF Transcript_13163/g.24494 Transcript_13163/m.24494 type:complete len:201 (+) Transcript_13163:378-980(+)